LIRKPDVLQQVLVKDQQILAVAQSFELKHLPDCKNIHSEQQAHQHQSGQ
jgi:hypothetical protein